MNDTTCYRFDLDDSRQSAAFGGRAGYGEAPAGRAGGANPYGRDAWTRPSRAARPAPAPSRPRSRRRAAAAGRAEAEASSRARQGADPARCGVREGLRLLPVVGAVAFAVLLIVAVFQLIDIYGSAATGGAFVPVTSAGAATAAPEGDADAGAPASTPRDQWRAGEVPFLYQTDPSWASSPYAGSDVATAGCGPTCLSMVYVALTGKTDYDPAAMAAFSERGGYVEDGMTAWRLMGDGAADLGLSSREVAAGSGNVLAELREGRPVICSVGPGDFTTTGHFIVLAGVADDGRVVVHDPNSPQNSARTWDADDIVGQALNYWSFGLA